MKRLSFALLLSMVLSPSLALADQQKNVQYQGDQSNQAIGSIVTQVYTIDVSNDRIMNKVRKLTKLARKSTQESLVKRTDQSLYGFTQWAKAEREVISDKLIQNLKDTGATVNKVGEISSKDSTIPYSVNDNQNSYTVSSRNDLNDDGVHVTTKVVGSINGRVFDYRKTILNGRTLWKEIPISDEVNPQSRRIALIAVTPILIGSK